MIKYGYIPYINLYYTYTPDTVLWEPECLDNLLDQGTDFARKPGRLAAPPLQMLDMDALFQPNLQR